MSAERMDGRLERAYAVLELPNKLSFVLEGRGGSKVRVALGHEAAR